MITLEQLKTTYPVIFSEKPADYVSDKYVFVPTYKIVETLMEKGWNVDAIRTPKFRKQKRILTGLHELTFSNPKFTPKESNEVRVLGQVKPVLRLLNSHNWSSRFCFLAGLFRLACLNGMYIPSGEIESINLRHDNISFDIDDVIERFSVTANKTFGVASDWNKLQLTDENRVTFSISAAGIRYKDEDYSSLNPYSLLAPRRKADEAKDLWTTFNVVQENLIRGGFQKDNRKVREIKNIDTDRRINEDLWSLAEETYKKLTSS